MSNDKQETIADIVETMRVRVELNRKSSKELYHGVLTPFEVETQAISDFADRLDAAAKREEDRRHDEVLSLQRTIVKMQDAIARQADAGNAAAMRAALERLLRQMQWEYAQEGDVGIAAVMDRGRISDNIDIAASALSAPARNCDRFQTTEDALDAFIREKEIKEEDVDNMNLRDFFDWLFAQAKSED